MTDPTSDLPVVEQQRSDTARLLEPLTEAQQSVNDVIGHAFWKENVTWPTFFCVEAEMDNRGLDLREVLATLPMIGGAQGLIELQTQSRHLDRFLRGNRRNEPRLFS